MKLAPIDMRMLVFAAWMTLCVFSTAMADDELQGDIRFSAANQQEVWVGQQQELYLELWTSGFSFSGQSISLPEVSGAYLVQPDSSTVKLSEQRDGTQWQGLRYTVLMYPQRAGQVEVPAFDISFSARAGFGTEPARFTFTTQPLSITSRLPPGARADSLLVTTSSFRLDASWQPQASTDGPIELKVGDAIKLTVSRSAQEVPGMMFDPLPVPEIDGLGIYPGKPEVNDQVNRGNLSGRRVDSLTFICQQEGNFQLPAFRFQWWDPQAGILSEEVIEPVQLAVNANPAYAPASGQTSVTSQFRVSWRLVVLYTVGVFLLLALARVYWPRILQYFRSRAQSYRASEAWAFKQAIQACRDGQALSACNAINLWISRAHSDDRVVSLTELAADSGNAEFIKEATTLQQCVASETTREWNGRSLSGLLKQQRNERNVNQGSGHVLQPLNPRPAK